MAIFRAAAAIGGDDEKTSQKLSKQIVEIMHKRFKEKIPNIEEVQNVVEEVLMKEGHAKTAKAYILYRAKRAELRAAAAEAARTDDDEKADLLHMFAHKSKLAALVGYDRLEAYKNLLFHIKELQKSGKLPASIWKKSLKTCLQGLPRLWARLNLIKSGRRNGLKNTI